MTMLKNTREHTRLSHIHTVVTTFAESQRRSKFVKDLRPLPQFMKDLRPLPQIMTLMLTNFDPLYKMCTKNSVQKTNFDPLQSSFTTKSLPVLAVSNFHFHSFIPSYTSIPPP